MDIHQNYAFFTNYGCALIERLNNVTVILKSTLIITNYEGYLTFIVFSKYIKHQVFGLKSLARAAARVDD